MNRILFGMILLGYTGAAAALECNQQNEGKRFCISGETMRCSKKFSQETKDFTYRWDGVNASGQSFDTNTQLYRKVPGFTPAACQDSSPSVEKKATEKNRG